MDKSSDDMPTSIDPMLMALADGELDCADQAQALAKLASDPRAAHLLASQVRLKKACARVMDNAQMKCPDALAGKLLTMAGEASSTAGPSARRVPSRPATTARPVHATRQSPAVIARIGRWMPTAVAAVILFAAGLLVSQLHNAPAGLNTQAAAFLSTDQIKHFTSRHLDCAEKPQRLHNAAQFGSGADFEQLPGRLGDYFNTQADQLALNLGGIGYQYQLAGTCSLPGSGAVHIVYHKQNDPAQSISLWIVPAKPPHQQLEQGRVYTEAGQDLLHPVIFWRDKDLLYYLVGDSIEDCDKAVQQLRQAV